ncbi:MAG: family 43 glycosylhydrolase [Tyzzerella sp.]|nr:family 43 glycosylhydrolase [Tyzzerella sp.]
MEKKSKLSSKKLMIIIAAVFLVCAAALGILAYSQNRVKQVASEEDYGYVNPDETKADPDAGITIDGVLDEKEYQDNNWLYMRNDNGNATVDIAMTSYYGEKGMYFVYDVTESTPIYVNLNRSSTFNSCVEMYLALSDVTSMDSSEIFEIDLLPTGDMVFKQRNGKGAFMDVATTSDKMAHLGATTKGGEINTEDCYGYCLEFYIPWDYLEFLGMDVKEIKTDYVFVNTAHITSYNYAGNAETDRYWYSFAQQLGGNGWGNVSLYYRFDKDGVIGTVPVELVQGDHYTMEGVDRVIPGVKTHVEITPEDGYAINSILVNGEEYIKKVSYNEDGSISLDIRGVKEGLKISASAEAVTEGNKTLSGTVKVHKVGGDSLKGVTASYVGPNGEKPITIDSKGNFKLTDLKQGFYTITVEKAGYEKIERGIYLNRNIDTELVLEYLMFEVESGRCWQLEYVNDGIINKMGGFGSLVTTDSYKKFSVEANFKYYEDVAESLEEQDRQEQRQGIRIKFSNDKYWHIDLLYQKEKYFIQYAKATTASIFNFRDIYVLSEEEVEKFKSEDGIQLKVVRDGNRAIIYLGGNLIAVEDLDKEYVNLTARVGFESWGPFTDVRSMEYKITSDTGVDVNALYFGYHKAWDVTKQFEGVVSQPKGGNTVWLRFFEKLTDIDMTIKVLDNPKSDKVVPSTNLRFEFDNDKVFLASIGINSGDGTIHIWNQKSTTNAKTKSLYKFTTDEQAQYMTEEGIDFRFVRSGTELLFFIGGEYKTSVDLSEYIKDDTKAIVSIQHHGDQDVPYVMPFTVSEQTDSVTITQKESAGKEYKTEKGTTVSVSAEEGYYIKKLSLNGKDVSEGLTLDGRYIFVAEEANYTMKATLVKCIFETTYGWNLLEQNQGTKDGVTTGMVSLPDGGTTRTNLSFIKKYADMDLTWRIKDHPNSDASNTTAPRTSFEFIFDEVLKGDNKKFTLSVSESNKGVVQIQNTSGLKDKAYYSYYNFDEEDTAKYRSADGIDFRMVRQGTNFHLFVDGEYKTSVDLSEYIKADTKATVRINHNDDEGVKLEMPYAVTDKVDIGKIYFGYHRAWDVTNQFNGSVSQPKGGNTVWLRFLEKITTMDLNIKILDNPNSDEEVPSTNVRFEFDGGETFLVSVGVNSNDGTIHLWNQKSTTNEKAKSLFKFSAEEQAQYETEEGIDFRVVRNGTDVLFFLDGEYKACVDLSEFVEADTPAIVSIQHVGDKGVPYVMPFTMIETLTPIKVKDNTEETLGSLKTLFAYNETIVVKGDELNDSSKYLSAIQLDNNEETPLSMKGIITFHVAGDSHTVTGKYKTAIFEANNQWILVNQNQGTKDGVTSGVVTLPNGGDSNTLYLYRSGSEGQKGYDYGDIDLTLTLRDYQSVGDKPRYLVKFIFKTGNGEKVLQLYVDEGGRIRTSQHTTLPIGSNVLYNFTTAEASAYRGNGIDVRILREGAKLSFYVGGEFKKSLDLAAHIDNETMSRIGIVHNYEAGVQVDIPYKLSFPTKKVIGQDGAKYLSILGDGISMCTGMPNNPDGTSTATNNSTTAVNNASSIYGNPLNFGIKDDWTKTYWGRSLETNNMQLLVNNSVSGGKLYEDANATTHKAGYKRAGELHANTGALSGEKPDVIYLYMGTEDRKQTGVNNRISEFEQRYRETLNMFVSKYPDAEIFCFTTMAYSESGKYWGDGTTASQSATPRMQMVNASIRKITSEYENATLVDIADIIKNDDTFNSHFPTTGTYITPMASTHKKIAERLQEALESQFRVESQITLVNETEDEGYLSMESPREIYALGDKVVIKTEAVNASHYLHSLTVDGKKVEVSSDGTYELTVSRVSHVVESTFRKKIFEDNTSWVLSEQNQGTVNGVTSGVVTLLNGGDSNTLYLYRSSSDGQKGYDYGDIDLTLTLRDYQAVDGKPRFLVKFIFKTDSGEKVLQLYVDEGGRIRTSQHDSLPIGSNVLYNFATTEASAYRGDGVDVRILREGTKLSFYVDGEFKKSLDLATHIDSGTMSRIGIIHNYDEGVQVDIPYKLSFPEKESTEGKYLSILGDGISMSTGEPDSSLNNTTIANNNKTPSSGESGIYGNTVNNDIGSDYTKLYWAQSLTANGMQLLVNNSVCEGKMATYDTSTNPILTRAVNLHADTGTLNGTEPDVIYLYMGTEDRKQKNLGDGQTANLNSFETAYRATLQAITDEYQDAEVFCFTTMGYDSGAANDPYRGEGGTNPNSGGVQRMRNANNIIKKVASEFEHVTLVDISHFITKDNYRSEGYFKDAGKMITPSLKAHNKIAEILQEALESQFKVGYEISLSSTGKGEVKTDKAAYKLGNTATITTIPANDNCYLASLKVDGEPVEVNAAGTYSFTVTKNNHTVEAIFKDKISVVTINDTSLFYINDKKTSIADPFVLDNGDGTYYLYGTTASGLDTYAYSSTDLMTWTEVGSVLDASCKEVLQKDIWAPEVVKEGDTYYMFFSATPKSDGSVGNAEKQLMVATSKNPDKGFKLVDFTDKHAIDANKYSHSYAKYLLFEPETYTEFAGRNSGYTGAIDPHPYVDEAGTKYLFWKVEQAPGNICVVKMNNWLEPDWSTAKVVLDSTGELNDNVEGPAVIKHGSKYYLTYSTGTYENNTYQVRVAYADSITGAYTKLSAENGGILLSGEQVGNPSITGTGHHSFVTVGEQLYIVYHKHDDLSQNGKDRHHAIDEVKWNKNGDDLDVMYVNGPTSTYQPKIIGSAYTNIAGTATVSGTTDASYLTDGLLSVQKNGNATFINNIKETSIANTTTFTFEFNSVKEVGAIMTYNSKNDTTFFKNISRIEMIGEKDGQNVIYYMNNVKFNEAYYTDNKVIPGSAAYAVFNPLNIKSIKITVEVPAGQSSVGISEIKILGK